MNTRQKYDRDREEALSFGMPTGATVPDGFADLPPEGKESLRQRWEKMRGRQVVYPDGTTRTARDDSEYARLMDSVNHQKRYNDLRLQNQGWDSSTIKQVQQRMDLYGESAEQAYQGTGIPRINALQEQNQRKEADAYRAASLKPAGNWGGPPSSPPSSPMPAPPKTFAQKRLVPAPGGGSRWV
jgi:hypothetical protein